MHDCITGSTECCSSTSLETLNLRVEGLSPSLGTSCQIVHHGYGFGMYQGMKETPFMFEHTV